MTKRKVPRPKASNGAENPEIRRAAERLNGASSGHAAGELPRLPAERTETEFQKQARMERGERDATLLSRLVTGGLWIAADDEGNDSTPERAMLHVGGAMAKAIMLAQGAYTDGQGPEGWALDGAHDEMSHADTMAAMSGLVAMLQCGPRALDALRDARQYRDSVSRSEIREERGETDDVVELTPQGKVAAS